MLTNNRTIIFAFLSVLGFAFLLNTVNVAYVKKQITLKGISSSEQLVHNQTIYSIDNSWYLPQIKNALSGKGFTCDTTDYKFKVRRTPGYPMYYGIHYLLFGEKKSFFFIKITQTILFACSAIAILFAAFYFTDNKKIAWLCYFIYGFNPTLISYTYYTLTESISPAIFCFILYFFAKALKYGKLKYWFFTGFVFSIGALCRPTIFLFGGSIALAILLTYFKSIKQLANVTSVFGLAVLLIFGPYVIRNYIVSKGDFVLLEKFYGDPMNYGMQNIELRKWISTWINPADYSSERISNKMISHILQKRDKNVIIDSLLSTIPTEAYSSYPKNTVHAIYGSVYDYYDYKINKIPPKNLDSAEQSATQFIRLKTTTYIRNNPLNHYFIMPIKMMKSIIFQSNSGTILFLNDYRENKLFFLIKLYLLLLNIYLFATLAANLLFIRKYLLLYSVIIFFILINCSYMIYGINYFEARYLIPLFPLMYISGAIFGVELFEIVKKKLHF